MTSIELFKQIPTMIWEYKATEVSIHHQETTMKVV